jgi:protein SCO1
MRVRALIVAALVCAAGCSKSPDLTPGTGQFRGTEVPTPRPKPAFTLTATTGQPYDFPTQTAGRVTLLFFGYTSCPDICPVHLANIAAVLKRLDPAERDRIRVVFVSTDPERDSLTVIRRWLDNFDPTFVGLRGTLEDVNAFQAGLGLPPAQVTRSAAGQVEVGHAAVVLAFDAEGMWRLSYPFGMRQDDWAHDLPLLVSGRWTTASGPPRSASVGGMSQVVGDLRVDDARVPAMQGTATLAFYGTFTSAAASDDWLVRVEAPGLATDAMLHGTSVNALGQTTMAMLDSLLVPAGGRLVFAPGGQHVMLGGLTRQVAEGDMVPVVFVFRRAGRITIPAMAVSPADAQGR